MSNQEEGEKLEIIVLSQEKEDGLEAYINSLGGSLEDLGYGYKIITIDITQILKVISYPSIQYAEFPKSLFLSDVSSNKAICVDRVQNEFGLKGKGIIIGFVDSGIDFTHPAFQDEQGNTRIEYILDLSLGKSIVYNKQEINEALKQSEPYKAVPVYDVMGHGTHVVGIACAGGNINKKYYGVAPESSIIMVKANRGSFTLSTALMRGIKFLVDKSKELDMPLVINISMSTNDGAHNGSSLLEKYISLVAQLNRVTIVIAAGNEGAALHHASGKLEKENYIDFNVEEDETGVVLNLYKSILPKISLELIAPTGASSGIFNVEEGYIEGVISRNKFRIYDTGPKPFDAIGEVGISLISEGNYILSGKWRIIIRVLNDYEGEFDIWLPISEGLNKKTKFLNPSIYNTLGIPATAENIISVGSYNYITKAISPFSGRGPKYQNDDAYRPCFVAPGEGIMSTAPNKSYDIKTGTSMAAPHVSGISALFMEWGINQGNNLYLYGERLKYYLIEGTKKGRADVIYPDSSWGYGEVCAYDSLINLIDILNLIIGPKPEYRIDEWYTTLTEYYEAYKDSDEKISILVEYNNAQEFLSLNSLENNISTTIMGDQFGVAYLSIKDLYILKNYIKKIVLDDNPQIFTLNNITPIEASDVLPFHNSPYLNLTGKGTIIAVIDTGIDYLNEEFQRENDTTRILKIWDQTIDSGQDINGIRMGSEYDSEKINEAIAASKRGENPYDIVPSRDENGHGTMVAGIAGARGRNPDLEGVAPDAMFIIVKLRQADSGLLSVSGISNPKVNTYGVVDLLLAIKYIANMSAKLNKPVSVLFPLGTNMGAHDGTDVISKIIEFHLTRKFGRACVVGTGNEGDSDTHVEGVIGNQEEEQTIEIQVDKRQKTLNFEIWVGKPDVFEISIVSPSGEVVDRIFSKSQKTTNIKFVYEETEMEVKYFVYNYTNGDELILVKARNLKEGIWKFKLYGKLVVNGQYYAWLPQRALLEENTKFLNPSQFTTLTIPSTAKDVISVAYYNQNNDTVVSTSGRGYTLDNRVKPDIAAGGVNAMVIGKDGKIESASGSSVATAIVTGIVSLILEWSIVLGNEKDISMSNLISYIIRGAKKRPGDNYPNKQWGYGMVNMEGIFDAIRGEYRIGNLFIRYAPKK